MLARVIVLTIWKLKQLVLLKRNFLFDVMNYFFPILRNIFMRLFQSGFFLTDIKQYKYKTISIVAREINSISIFMHQFLYYYNRGIMNFLPVIIVNLLISSIYLERKFDVSRSSVLLSQSKPVC